MTQARGNKNIHTHYHLRLVKEIRQEDDKRQIITHQVRAQAGGRGQKDKTMDFNVGTEKGALQKAREFCARSEKNKGELPGSFEGVVLVKATSPQSKSVTVSTNRLFVTKRPGREVGSTEWLYFLSPCGNAYSVDTRSVNNNPQRYIGSQV